MININEVKILSDYIANKHQTGAAQTPNEFNLCVQSSLDDVIMYYYGLPQRYAVGVPLPPVAWEVTQLVMDYLRDLKQTKPITVTAGRMSIPSDYIHKSVLTYDFVEQTTPSGSTADCDEDEPVACDDDKKTKAKTYQQLQMTNKITRKTKTIPVLTDEQFQMAKSSEVRKLSQKYPIARVMNGYFDIAPQEVKSVTLTYIRYPLTPVWGYTVPNGIDPQYNPSTSVNIELPAILKNQVAYSVLTKLGINIRENQLQAFVEMMKKNGQ
jgi:hypothetical protein